MSAGMILRHPAQVVTARTTQIWKSASVLELEAEWTRPIAFLDVPYTRVDKFIAIMA